MSNTSLLEISFVLNLKNIIIWRLFFCPIFRISPSCQKNWPLNIFLPIMFIVAAPTRVHDFQLWKSPLCQPIHCKMSIFLQNFGRSLIFWSAKFGYSTRHCLDRELPIMVLIRPNVPIPMIEWNW